MKKKYEMKQQNTFIRVLEGKDIINAGRYSASGQSD